MRKFIAIAGAVALLTGPACTPPQNGNPGSSTSPQHLEITGRTQLPPFYTLRWVAPSGVTVDHYNVFRSTASIPDDDPSGSLISSSTDTSLVVEIDPDTGVQFFRVSDVDTSGVESPLSAQFALDTTRRAVYRADATIDNTFELFVAPSTGVNAIAVSGVLTSGRSVTQFAWAPNAQSIAFLADLDVAGREELYVTSPDGTIAPVKLSGATVNFADVTAFAWSPDGQQLAFIADRIEDGVFDLYAVSFLNRTPVLISPSISKGTGYDGVRQFAWSADSTLLAFTADSITDNLFELFVVNPTNPNPQRVSGALAPLQGAFDGVLDFAWAPDASRIAYIANSTLPGSYELFTVASLGSNALNISGPFVAQGTVGKFSWSPDSSTVAFLANKDVSTAVALYTVPGDGSASSQAVSGLFLPGSAVNEFAWSREGNRLAFRGDVEVVGLRGLYTVDPTGANRVRVSGPLGANTFVLEDWAWSTESSQLGFRGSLGITPNNGLFTALADGTSVVNDVPELQTDRNIDTLAWTPDGTQLLFASNLQVPDQITLYLAPVDPATALSTRVAAFMPQFANVKGFAPSPMSSEDVPGAGTAP